MSHSNSSAVPVWVRSLTCVAGSLSIPALILVASLGTDVTIPLASLVGLYALRTAGFAFRDRTAGPSIVPNLIVHVEKRLADPKAER